MFSISVAVYAEPDSLCREKWSHMYYKQHSLSIETTVVVAGPARHCWQFCAFIRPICPVYLTVFLVRSWGWTSWISTIHATRRVPKNNDYSRAILRHFAISLRISDSDGIDAIKNKERYLVCLPTKDLCLHTHWRHKFNITNNSKTAIFLCWCEPSSIPTVPNDSEWYMWLSTVHWSASSNSTTKIPLTGGHNRQVSVLRLMFARCRKKHPCPVHIAWPPKPSTNRWLFHSFHIVCKFLIDLLRPGRQAASLQILARNPLPNVRS